MIGILGGTFDPIHNGHLYIADAAATAFDLEKVLFVPSRDPPHRDSLIATAEQRAEMVQLAIEGDQRFEFSDVELERPGPSYMIDTLKTLRRTYADKPLALIIGADAFAAFDSWLHPEEILEYCQLIVVNRDLQKESAHTPDIDPDKIMQLNIESCDISATMIRERLAKHEPIDELTPTAVVEYLSHLH